MIGIVDYRAGNAPSVLYACERLGIAARLVDDPGQLATVDRIVLPGVGAARPTIESLEEAGLAGALTERVRDGGLPFLGICIGLQIIFEHSEEGDTPGLGWLGGTVRRFAPGLAIPQIGWNAVEWTRTHPLIDGLPSPAHCYFVNSYYADPTEPDAVLGRTEYGTRFCAMVASGNIAATQFHAEKSGEIGLHLLRAFSRWEP